MRYIADGLRQRQRLSLQQLRHQGARVPGRRRVDHDLLRAHLHGRYRGYERDCLPDGAADDELWRVARRRRRQCDGCGPRHRCFWRRRARTGAVPADAGDAHW